MRKWFKEALAWILHALKVRFVAFNVNRIGHLSMEVECHLKMRKMGLIPKTIDVVIPPWQPDRQVPANKVLKEYWSKHFIFVTSAWWEKFLRPIADHPKLRVGVQHYIVAIGETALYYDIQTKWGEGPPLLKLKSKHAKHADEMLRKWGLEEDDWFVCIHSREPGFAPNEDQEYRDSDILTFNLAIQDIIDRGGWVIRMGDSTMQELPLQHPRLIDYAHSSDKSELLDVVLAAKCKFFLGSCSGLASVPVVFNIPVVSVNICPLSAVLNYGYRDLAIPKLMWSNKEQRYLSFEEVLASPVANFRYQNLFNEADVTIVNNTAEEILDVTREMFDLIEKKTTLEADKRQAKFNSLLREGHYSYRSSARVSAKFLKRHEHLLLTLQRC